MTKQELKTAIESKFGTMASFTRLSGVPYYDLQKLFAKQDPTQMELLLVASIVKETHNSDEQVITKGKIDYLKKSMKKYGGVAKFCRDNPQYPIDTIKGIFAGKSKRTSQTMVKLLKHFELMI